MDIARLTPHNFVETIGDPRLSVVIFGSLNCEPCEELKEILSGFGQVRVCEFHVSQLGSSQILADNRVGYIPRGIFYRNGQEVGRFLGSKTPETLASFVDELGKTGRIACDPDDVEERSFFINRVKDCLGWNFCRDIPRDQWEKKIAEWEQISEDLMSSNPDWRWLSDDVVKSLLSQRDSTKETM